MNGDRSPEVRTVLVLVGDQGARRSTVRCIERRGHRAVRVSSVSEALSRAFCTDVTAVVVDVDHWWREECVDLVLALAHLRPDMRVLVGHRENNLEAMWQAFRCGATPWVVPSGGQRQVDLPAFDVRRSPDGDLAIDALQEELGGHHGDACSLLAQIADGDVDAAVEALIETGAAALVHLRDRARYATSIDVLLAHLPEHRYSPDPEALTLWWTMIEATAFRASGLRLELPELGGNDRDALFGAFHAAATVLRFTARRRWRRPIDALHEFAHDGSARPRLEPDHQNASLGGLPVADPPLTETKPAQATLEVTG